MIYVKFLVFTAILLLSIYLFASFCFWNFNVAGEFANMSVDSRTTIGVFVLFVFSLYSAFFMGWIVGDDYDRTK